MLRPSSLIIRRKAHMSPRLPLAFTVLLLVANASMAFVPVSAPSSLVTIAPNALDFGSRPVGTRSEEKTAIVTNTGNGILTIHDLTVSGIDFSETNSCQRSLAPGADCKISVTFKPVITGPRLGTIIITDSDVGSPHMLVLSGIGQ
jgi:trimeric autotransporter adhesin